MTRQAAVRAGSIHDTLQNLDTFEAGARARVLARVPAESSRVLLETVRPAWVPVAHDHFVADAIVATFGLKRSIEFWRYSFIQHLERPLLRTFAEGVLGALGREPATVVGIFVRGWGLAYRDMCSPRYLLVGGQPAIAFEDVAPEVRKYPAYFASWEGAMRGFAHVARVRGDVHFDTAPDRSSAQAVFTWREDSAQRG